MNESERGDFFEEITRNTHSGADYDLFPATWKSMDR